MFKKLNTFNQYLLFIDCILFVIGVMNDKLFLTFGAMFLLFLIIFCIIIIENTMMADSKNKIYYINGFTHALFFALILSMVAIPVNQYFDDHPIFVEEQNDEIYCQNVKMINEGFDSIVIPKNEMILMYDSGNTTININKEKIKSFVKNFDDYYDLHSIKLTEFNVTSDGSEIFIDYSYIEI